MTSTMVADPTRLEDLLEVLCITYNRADDLDRTLRQLAESPVAGCRITVLDNASTDDTPVVCAGHLLSLPQLRTVRHRKNVGASANYLHAVELAEAPYTWIICDDDTYDFSLFEDVIDAITSESFDLVSLGAAGGYRWVRGVSTTTTELAGSNPGFHIVSSFVPSLIFRTSLFDSSALAQGYAFAGSLFPHFPFVRACAEQTRSIYVAREQTLFRGGDNNVLSLLQHFSLWVTNCRSIADVDACRQVIHEYFELGVRGVRWRFTFHLAGAIAYERLEHPGRLWREVHDIALGLTNDQRLLLALLLPLAVTPRSLLRIVRLVRWGRAAKAIPPPADVDPLRM